MDERVCMYVWIDVWMMEIHTPGRAINVLHVQVGVKDFHDVLVQ